MRLWQQQAPQHACHRVAATAEVASRSGQKMRKDWQLEQWMRLWQQQASQHG